MPKQANPRIDIDWEVPGCAEKERSPNDYWAEIYCSSRQEERALASIMTGEEGELFDGDPDIILFKYDMGNWDSLFRPVLLVDCCSLFSEILRIQPRSEGKCAKLLLNHLRDPQALIATSYIGAPDESSQYRKTYRISVNSR